jgi:hypothetical protein
MLKTLLIAVIAVCSWMFVAPKVWPAHPAIATGIMVGIASLLVEILWPKSASKPELSIFFAFAHLAVTAFRADSLRCSAVIAAALAGPPFFPPFLPSFARYSLSSAGIPVFAILGYYTRAGYVVNRRKGYESAS